jgi:hypothetical protein
MTITVLIIGFYFYNASILLKILTRQYENNIQEIKVMLGNKVHLKDRRTKNYIDHYKVHVYLKDVPGLRIKEILSIHKSPNNVLLVVVSTKNI